MNSDADSEVCSLSRPFLYTIRFDAYNLIAPKPENHKPITKKNQY